MKSKLSNDLDLPNPSPPAASGPDLPDWSPLSLERAVAAQPTHRYETAEESLLVLEQADRQELEHPSEATP